MFSLMNVTEPSAKAASTPPPCLLRGGWVPVNV
jgi:hypothetical protein